MNKNNTPKAPRNLLPTETRWHFVKDNRGLIFLHKSNGLLKKNNKDLGHVVSVDVMRSDTKDEKLKVKNRKFLLCSKFDYDLK